MNYQTDWTAVAAKLPLLLHGLVFTIQISITAYAISLIVGLVIGLARRSHWQLLKASAFAYTQFFRSISIYIYILWIYFGLPVILGINLTPFAASVASLVLLNSAYMSEIYRSAIAAIDVGQREAALSLGMGRIVTFFDVTLPQALRIAVPQLINQFTMIIKDSSVVAVIGAGDLMYQTIAAANLGLRSFEFYTTAAAIYLGMVTAVSWLGNTVERRLRVGLA